MQIFEDWTVNAQPDCRQDSQTTTFCAASEVQKLSLRGNLRGEGLGSFDCPDMLGMAGQILTEGELQFTLLSIIFDGTRDDELAYPYDYDMPEGTWVIVRGVLEPR